MKRKTINIEEFDHNVSDSRSMIFKVIDTQINNYKLQFLTQWERDHTISLAEKDEKIKELQVQKDHMIALFRECEMGNTLIDFKISIAVTVKNKLGIAV